MANSHPGNILVNGDFRTGAIDVKVGNGSGTVATINDSTSIKGWVIQGDETDAATNQYIRVKNYLLPGAIAAGKITEPSSEVHGDSILIFERSGSTLGASRTGHIQVEQVIPGSGPALSDQTVEVNFFVYSQVAGLFGLVVDTTATYTGGTADYNLLNTTVHLQAGWNRVRRVLQFPHVPDTHPVYADYLSSTTVFILNVDQGNFATVNINTNLLIGLTGVSFGLAGIEFDRIEELVRQAATTVAISSVGVPTGGTTGQVLSKNSNTSLDTGWTSPNYVIAGGTTGQVLSKSSNTDYALSWTTPTVYHSVIAGGTTGQFLTKNSNTDYDLVWATVTATHSVPAGGATGTILKKNSATDYDASFLNILRGPTAQGGTTGTLALDLAASEIQTVVLTGAPTFNTTNRAAGLFLSIRIDANGADRALSFNASWKWLGTDNSAGVTLSNGKIAVLSLTCYGTNETDIVAVYAAQP